MGVCFYCCLRRPSHEECSSWSEARVCCGTTGPDDPKYTAAARAHDERKARDLLDQADRVEREAAAEAARLRARAAVISKSQA